MADFKVTRGTAIIPGSISNVVITEGVQYSLDLGSSANAFCRIINTHHTGMGRTVAGGQQSPENYSVSLLNGSNIATSLTFVRYSAIVTDNCRIDWEIIEYIGPKSGGNEFLVRNFGELTPPGATTTASGIDIGTISTAADVVIFNTGQRSITANRNDIHAHLFTYDLVDSGGGNFKAVATRGVAANHVAQTSYAVVEFTGGAWSGFRQEFTDTGAVWDPGDSISFTVSLDTTLTDLQKSFIADNQYRTDNDSTGIDEADDVVVIDSTTNLRVYNNNTAGTRTKVCWILQNSQSGGATDLSAFHEFLADDTVTGSEERVFTSSLDPTFILAETSLMGICASVDGAGRSFPRGSINARLTATDTLTFTEADMGVARRIGIEIVAWPTLTGPAVSRRIISSG